MIHYTVKFNGGCADGRLFKFKEFGNAVSLWLGKNCATFTFWGKYRIEPDLLVTFQTSGLPYVIAREDMTDSERDHADVGYAFRGCFRKMYLVHAIVFNSGMEINSISISIDSDAAVEYTRESNPNFPFMTSMLPAGDLKLPASIIDNQNIIDTILLRSKTAADNDLMLCALQAYMLSKTREYAVDRFLNLWTAMNAVYNWLAREFQWETSYNVSWEYAEEIFRSYWQYDSMFPDMREDVIDQVVRRAADRLSREKKIIDELTDKNDKTALEKVRRSMAYQEIMRYCIPDSYLFFSNDADGIAAIMEWICPDAYFPARFNIENVHVVSLALQSCIASCTDKRSEDGTRRLHELYDTALDHMKDKTAPMNGFDRLFDLAAHCCDHLEHIPGQEDEGNIPLYCFLLLAYPYILRCNLFHGSKTQTVIAAYDDPEMLDYKVVCEFLDRFLEERLPQIFSGHWHDGDPDWYERIEDSLKRRFFSQNKDADWPPRPTDNAAARLRKSILKDELNRELRGSRYE